MNAAAAEARVLAARLRVVLVELDAVARQMRVLGLHAAATDLTDEVMPEVSGTSNYLRATADHWEGK